jgi:hypothetical protein
MERTAPLTKGGRPPSLFWSDFLKFDKGKISAKIKKIIVKLMFHDIIQINNNIVIIHSGLGKNMPVLKLSKHNEEKEIEFELKYLMSLTTKQRFQIMFNKQQEILKLLKKNANRETTEIIKRT